MKKTVDKSESEIISLEFAKRYSQWLMPVDDIETIIKNLSKEERQAHYRQLGDILEKKAFHREIDEWKRRLTRTLAMNDTLSDIHRQGLRQTLVAVEEFEKALRSRAGLAAKMESLKPLAKFA